MLVRRTTRLGAALLAFALTTGCSEEADEDLGNTAEDRAGDIFDSFLLGVQQAENLSGLSKERGALDESTDPPSYQLNYSGCADGGVSGRVCIEDGVQTILVLEDGTNIISSLAQTYRFENYANDEAVVLSGTLDVDVQVGVNPAEETTTVEGAASGMLTVDGDAPAQAEFDVVIAGGRVYTQDVSTEVEVAGTLLLDGEPHDVAGGFARG